MVGALIERLQRLGTGREAAQRVEALAQPVETVPAGSVITRLGEDTNHIHLLVEGWVGQWQDLRDGRRQIVAFAVRGEFCDLEALDGIERGASLSTFSACHMHRLPVRPLQRLIESDAKLRAAFQRLMRPKQLMAQQLILSLGRRAAIERIAHLLCEVAVRLDGVPQTDAISFPLALTQTNIADIAGLSVVHVNRSLQLLKLRLGVMVRARQVIIPSWSELTKLAEFEPSYLDVNDNRIGKRTGSPHVLGATSDGPSVAMTMSRQS